MPPPAHLPSAGAGGGRFDAHGQPASTSIRQRIICIQILQIGVATTLRVDDQTKAKLERLRAELMLATGRRPSLEETLRLLASRAMEHQEVLLPELADDAPPRLTEAQARRLRRLRRRWGVVIPPEDIDAIVGKPQR